MKTDKIILSSLNPNDTWGGTSIRQDSKLVDAEGICICIPATHAQHQFKVLIRNSENMEEAKIEHTVLGWTRDSKGKVVNRHPVEVANCVTASKRDNTQNYVCCAMRGCGESGNTRQQIEPRKDDLTNTITTVQKDNMVSNNNIRIRKLTPRECFRLMGVDDTDIDTIQAAGISNSQQYKMAGNSIVVDVLYHIFRKLLVEPGQEGNSQTLF